MLLKSLPCVSHDSILPVAQKHVGDVTDSSLSLLIHFWHVNTLQLYVTQKYTKSTSSTALMWLLLSQDQITAWLSSRSPLGPGTVSYYPFLTMKPERPHQT